MPESGRLSISPLTATANFPPSFSELACSELPSAICTDRLCLATSGIAVDCFKPHNLVDLSVLHHLELCAPVNDGLLHNCCERCLCKGYSELLGREDYFESCHTLVSPDTGTLDPISPFLVSRHI